MGFFLTAFFLAHLLRKSQVAARSCFWGGLGLCLLRDRDPMPLARERISRNGDARRYHRGVEQAPVNARACHPQFGQSGQFFSLNERVDKTLLVRTFRYPGLQLSALDVSAIT